jgi:hypothetical protein
MRAARQVAWAAAVTIAALGGLPGTATPDRLSLATLEIAGTVTVSLDASRFKQERVATIKIENKSGFAVEGTIPACSTIFAPKDGRFSPLRPGESGNFLVGANRTVLLTRPFRQIDPKKQPPDGTTYVLNDALYPEPGCKD